MTGRAALPGRDVIAELRAMQPRRRMSWPEARSIVERQAATLLDLMHITEPPVPQSVIVSVPGIEVDWREDWPKSATTFVFGSYARIVVRSTDSHERQRFSLAHEFAHVLTDPSVKTLHGHLGPDQRHEREEQLANYFAACLLMPRPWVRHDYYGGLPAIGKLARRYDVSTEAMTTRLSELGLDAGDADHGGTSPASEDSMRRGIIYCRIASSRDHRDSHLADGRGAP